MPIPYIPLPPAGNTQINATAPNLGAMTAVTRGLSDTVQGISNVAQAFDHHADKIQAMENTWQESEARQAISRDFSEFETSLDTNTDPATYLPALEKTLTRTGSITANEKLTPAVREKLTLYHSEFANNARIRIAERAASMTTKRASMAIQNELDAAMQWNDRAAFESGLERAEQGGLLLPEQRVPLQQKFDENEAYNQAIQAIEADPLSMADDLNNPDLNLFPGVSPQNRDKLTRYAEQKKNTVAAETWEAIQIASLDGTTLSKDEITQMAKDGDITAAQAGSYLRAYHGPTPPQFEPLIYDNARSMVSSYDPAKDPTGAIRANIAAMLATTPLPKEYITELQSQFKARSTPDSPDAPKHRLAAEYDTRLESEWKAESFGNWYEMETDPIDGRISRKIITEQDFDRALSYKTKVKDTFSAWLQTQPPDLDPIEAGKKYTEIKSSILKNDMPPPDLFIPSMAPMPSFSDPLEGVSADGAPGVLPMPPQDGPKTSAIQFKNPIKLSNYGYATDSTPDSWSAKGIGHANNKLIDGTSAAITKTLANDLGLKTGDWFIAKTTKGDFRLRYDDTVPATDKRTGPLPPTIDIYRKTKGSNSWGGKVLGLQKTDPPEKVSDIRSAKTRLFQQMRPTTPEAAQALIEQLHNLANLSTLDA